MTHSSQDLKNILHLLYHASLWIDTMKQSLGITLCDHLVWYLKIVSSYLLIMKHGIIDGYHVAK